MSFQPLDSLLASPDSRECEELDILLELSDAEISRIRKIYEVYGKNAKKLNWCNWTQYEVPATVIVELLNLLPNLESLQLSSWNKKFSGEIPENSLQLSNLKSIDISECGEFVLEFLATALPDNTLETLKETRVRDGDANFSALIAKQKSIKNLDISGMDFKTFAPLQELKLKKLRAVIYKSDEKQAEQAEFLKNLISSQTSLTCLDLLDDSAYSHTFVDDTIFAEITKLSNLETLIISVDGVSQISGFEGLNKLKELHLKTCREKSLEIFKELAAIGSESVERLTLNLWTFEIPTETYEAFGENFKNLKSVKITLGTKHKINFYAKALPNVEELSIRFGESNNTVEFSQIYESSTGVVNENLKRLDLQLWGGEMINSENFFEMLRIFPNLEKLKISSKFPFCGDFFNQLSQKLGNIKNIRLSLIEIKNNETFPASTTDALKGLAAKVKFAKLTFRNVQHCDFGGGVGEGNDGEDRSFSYQPLIASLAGVYKACESSMANIRIMNDLVLTAGNEN